MPVLNIQGKRVRVDDSFLLLSPEQQNAQVQEIAGQIGIRPQEPESQTSEDLRSELSAISRTIDNPTTRQSLAEAQRDKFYQSGIYAGEGNPLGPIAKTIDAFASGAQRAPLLGWDDEAGAGLNTVGGHAGDYEAARQGMVAQKEAQRQQNPVASVTGELAGSVVLAGGAPSFAGRAMQAGRTLPRIAFESAKDGALLGSVAGAGEADPGSRLENAGYGAVGGLAIGAALPVATAGIDAAARRAISPYAANAERTAAADYLRGEGVNLTAGQRTGSKGLRYMESELGGGRTEDLIEGQGEQFTRAALRRAGIDADRATPEVMDDAFARIGNDFDSLAARNKLLPDQQLHNDLISTAREYVAMVPPSARAPVVQDSIMDIAGSLNQGQLDGAAYQAMRSRLDRAARSSRNDPQLQQALYGIRNNLDDAMERNIAANNPGDSGAWSEARRQYRNMLTLERTATGAGEDAALGLISPQALRAAVVQKQGTRNYARGDGDFAELARSGAATMRAMPNSGTAGRMKAQALGAGATSLIGGTGAGYASGGDPVTTAAGFAAGVAAPRLAGAMLMSRPVQTYLGNQAATGAQMSPQVRAMVNKIMGIEAAPEAPQVGITAEDITRFMLGVAR